jgi:rRNA maturation RNase YbeY
LSYKTSISGDYLTIDYVDTSLKLGRPTFVKLKPWLKPLIKAFEEFLWSKKKATLNLPRPARGSKVQVSLLLCGREKMKKLNQRFRGKLSVTDVLSLQYIEEVSELGGIQEPFPLMLGDLMICREVTARQAKKFELKFEEEFIHLLTHGFLHLLNFDHERSLIEEKIMERAEKWILLRTSALKRQKRGTRGRS